MLDLICYSEHIGGIDRAAHLIGEMRPRLSSADMRRALKTPLETTLLQRTGFLLQQLGMDSLSSHVASALKGRRLQVTPLASRAIPYGRHHNHWRVYGLLAASDA